jgi:MFS family permease
MDRTGRLPLLIISAGGVTLGLGMLAIAFTLDPMVPMLAAGGLCCFMAFFSIGWGPLTGVYLAEVFPLRIR